MTNIISQSGVIARQSHGNVVPVMLMPDGAVGDGTTDDTAVFTALLAALPATGGVIVLEAGKRYAVNLTIDRDGVTIIGQAKGGDGNVLAGFTAFNAASPALTLGGGTTQRRGFTMIGGRIYAQTTKQLGLKIQGMADVLFLGTELGGFTSKTVHVTNTAATSTYYVNFVGCKFFATSSTTGNIIHVQKAATGFVTTVNLIGGNVDGSALGAGGMALRIADSSDIWCQGTHFQLRDGKGVAIEGAAPATGGRWHVSGCIVDTSDTPSSAVLVTWPSTEPYPGSYVIGADVRINGQGRNSVPTTIDLRGVNQFGHGFLYAPQIFDAQLVGFLDLVNATAGVRAPRVTPVGGNPEGSLSGSPGDVAIAASGSDLGSSSVIYVKAKGVATNTGWQRLASGDYYQQTGPTAITVAATMDLLHDAGTFNVSSDASGTVTSLGTDTAIDSGRVRRLLIGGTNRTVTFTHTSSPTGGQMYCLGQANVPAQTGDVIDWLWLGSGSGWRMIGYWRFDARPFLPGRATYQPMCGHNLQFQPTQTAAAQPGVVTGGGTTGGTPAETIPTWDFDQTTTEYLTIQGAFDGSLLPGGNVIVHFAFRTTVGAGSNGGFKGAFRVLTGIDPAGGFNYTTNAVASGAVATGTAGVDITATMTFTSGAQLNNAVAGNSFIFLLWRDTSVASNAAADLRVLQSSVKFLAT